MDCDFSHCGRAVVSLRVTLNSLSRKDIKKKIYILFFFFKKRAAVLLVWYYFWQHHKPYIKVVQA